MIDPSSSQPPSLEELQILIPQLEILSFIGHGGMGTFYKARQPMMNRFAAVKIFLVDPVSYQALIEGFKREARAMAGLNHPHCQNLRFRRIRLHPLPGHGIREGRYFGAVDLIFESFGLQEIVAIVTQVCDALDHAHERGVIHRDIRPGNTMLDDDGEVKIGDFGLARLVGEELFAVT